MLSSFPGLKIIFGHTSTPPTVSDLSWTSVNFVSMRALHLSVYCYRDYTPFYSLPPLLSVFCNLILVWTQAPPLRQLTFPLIHRELPRRPNNYAAVYSHCTASSGLNQLIKAAAVNQLTNQGPLDILLLRFLSFFKFFGWGCLLFWEGFQIREEGDALCHIYTNSLGVLHKCIGVLCCWLSLLSRHLVWWRCAGLDLINCLSQSVDKCFLLEFVLYTIWASSCVLPQYLIAVCNFS